MDFVNREAPLNLTWLESQDQLNGMDKRSQFRIEYVEHQLLAQPSVSLNTF